MHGDIAESKLRGLQSIPRGLLRLLIVRLLQNRAMSGTEIMEELEKRSGGRWRPSPGSIYPMLAALREEGLIEISATEGRICTYQLSATGEKHIRDVFTHKDKLERSTGLPRRIWLELLDPNDRAHFHMNAVNFGSGALLDDVSHLTEPQRQKLKTRVERAIETLGQILEILNHGDSEDGQSADSDEN